MESNDDVSGEVSRQCISSLGWILCRHAKGRFPLLSEGRESLSHENRCELEQGEGFIHGGSLRLVQWNESSNLNEGRGGLSVCEGLSGESGSGGCGGRDRESLLDFRRQSAER